MGYLKTGLTYEIKDLSAEFYDVVRFPNEKLTLW